VYRVSQSVACVNLLLSFLLKYPRKVHIVRGNHETLSVNIRYGFLGEVIAYAGLEEQYQDTSFTQDNLPELYVAYNNTFGLMPLALLHEKTRYFFVHGGIPKEPISLKEIKQLPRSDLLVSNPIIMQLLWNDPAEDIERIGPSFRGDNIYTFGNELLEEFLTNNKVKKVIRAHQVFNDGFCYLFDDKLLSIFSSEEYYTTVQAKML
ncbi:MAG: metallophosphoesterase family protein, partial [Candidatus Heimdallarchaeota archaeon]